MQTRPIRSLLWSLGSGDHQGEATPDASRPQAAALFTAGLLEPEMAKHSSAREPKGSCHVLMLAKLQVQLTTF